MEAQEFIELIQRSTHDNRLIDYSLSVLDALFGMFIIASSIVLVYRTAYLFLHVRTELQKRALCQRELDRGNHDIELNGDLKE